MASPIFKAKFRITENTKAEKPSDPSHKMPMEFTPEDARAAAQYLIDMANKAEDESTTIRKYTSQTEFSEVPGFTCWLSLWDNSGSWSPMPIESANGKREQTERRKSFAVADEDDVPF